jgi:arylsulfatase A-like enzyme
LVSNIDIAPTLLRCAGHEPPRTMAGLNLLAADTDRKVVFAEAFSERQYMARTHTHKLLLCRDPSQSQFFDLKQDPYEMENRIDESAYQHVVSDLTARLLDWALFDAPSVTHLEEHAPVIDAPNVRPVGGEHWSASDAYYRHKMSEGTQTG